MIIVQLFTVTKPWKPPKCPLMKEWMSPMGRAHTVSDFSALQREAVLTPAPTRMNPRDVMLSEISQTGKDKHCVSLLIGFPES